MECIVVVVWFICALITAAVCEEKGHSAIAGFFLGLLLGPIGVIISAVLSRDEAVLEKRALSSGQMRKCPYCAEPVRWDAKVCRYCGRELTAAELLREGMRASKEGRKADARELLQQVVRQEPGNEKAWLWLSGAVATDAERQKCLDNVLSINPVNADALRGLETLGQRNAERVKTSASEWIPLSLFAAGGVAFALVVLALLWYLAQ
ncbi:MAG TPA: zinc ribbon domain-containing protein [Anaerolineae bacterium]|nr:zinc ribbon domain-containing protein [Anaerolineae bacterium]